MNQRREICCFWNGGRLNYLELLSLASFRDAGHDVALYSYGEIDVPDWVELRDAADVMAPGSAALRADRFRWRLLAARPGAIWAAPDFALIRPLEPEKDRLLAWSGTYLSADIVALPPDSDALQSLIRFTAEDAPIPPWADEETRSRLAAQLEAGEPVKAEDLEWGVFGARALTWFAAASGEIEEALPAGAFHPLSYRDRDFLLTRKAKVSAVENDTVAAIPLFGAETARWLQERADGLPRYWTPLGSLLRRHAVEPRSAPLFGIDPKLDDRWVDAPEPEIAEPAPAPPPAPMIRAKPAKKVLIVTTMKNEGPFILEWIAYHRSIGITDFVIYTNDCDDGTDEMHDLLAAKGIVTEHHDNPWKKGSKAKDPQRAALWDAETRDCVKEADWIIPMDVDEFVNIHVGEGRFQDMLDAVPGANMISMVWRLFGNGFVSEFKDGFVTEQMTRAAHARANKPHQAWGFKTAFQDIGAYKHFSVHRPQQLFDDMAEEIRWYSSAGRPLPERFKKAGWRVGKPEAGYGLVTLNHYSIRSSESYLVKRQRGRVNHVDRDQGMAYWFRMNHNAVEETSIAAKLPRAKAEFARLMADPDIAAMHARCVAAHKTRIEELHALPEYAALFEEVESRRMTNLSRILYNFGNAIFDKGPDAVPPEFLAWADQADLASRPPRSFAPVAAT